MIKEAIGTGNTVEEAFEAACKELGVESHEAEFEILEMPVKKTFGLFGGNPAKVRAYVKDSPADAAAQYLKNILSNMGLSNVQFDIQEEESGALISLSGEDVGFIIGHRGETLDALQYLTSLQVNKGREGYIRVTLDTENYRAKREDSLRRLESYFKGRPAMGENQRKQAMLPKGSTIFHNPNGSAFAVEGISSPDGRVFGRMAHAERNDAGLYVNVPGARDNGMFASAVNYFA